MAGVVLGGQRGGCGARNWGCGAEERRRGSGRFRGGDGTGALRLRCPGGEGMGWEARTGGAEQQLRHGSTGTGKRGGGAPVRGEDLGGRCGRWWGWDGSERESGDVSGAG